MNKIGKVCILGAGKTGIALGRYTTSLLGRGVDSVCVYTGKNPCDELTVNTLLSMGATVVQADKVEGSFDICITSPGISEFSDFFLSAKACSKEIVSEPEFAYRQSPDRWIAITGTNGKTTTTTLTNELLNFSGICSYAVGNIGNNCIDEVATRQDNSWFVAELSSYQLAVTSQFHPHVACLLNITPDHIAWHKSLDNYAKSKMKAFNNLDNDDLAVVSYDSDVCIKFINELKNRGIRVVVVDTHTDHGCDAAFVLDDRLIVRIDGVEHKLCLVSELNVFGDHNLENILAAASMALFVGCSDKDVINCLKEFKALEHRIEPVDTINDVLYVNDSKATNTDAVLKALTSFKPGSIVLLCGGYDKGTDIGEFSKLAARCCKACVCFGPAATRFEEALRIASDSLDIYKEDKLKDAFNRATCIASAKDVVLLSPACASFDEFSGYEERGRVFKSYVHELGNIGK